MQALVKADIKTGKVYDVPCYEYQSCEHEGWESSEGNDILDAPKETLK